MNSNYTIVVGLAIGMLLISRPTFSQTTIQGCSPTVLSLCVNDPGISLPNNNQFIVGAGTAGATSCSVHVQQVRTISSDCGGVIHYSIALVIDTVKYFIQPLTSIIIDSSGQVMFVLDTRLSEVEWIRNNGIPYNPECGSEYVIEWYVSDECGGEDYCEELLQVYDCQLPDISVITDTTHLAVPQGCQLTVFASDFVIGVTDDCLTEDDLLYSLSDSSLVSFQPLDYCALGLGVLTAFPIWAADQGRDVNCNDTIEWSERNLIRRDIPVVITTPGHCECFDNFTISGKVYTELERPLDMVEVTMTSSTAQYPAYVTEGDGAYYFNRPHGAFEDVTISASRNDNPRNGVSTLDVVKIHRHILKLDTLDSPYKIIAADANNSQSVTAIDIIELRKLILGIYTELPNSPSWKFIDAKYDFPDPHDPFPIHSPSTIVIPFAENLSGQDFIGIKVGDVNNTIRGNLQSVVVRNDPPAAYLHTPDQSFMRGDLVTIPVHATTSQKLRGFQFTLTVPGLEIIDVQSDVCEMTDDTYFLMHDRMTVSWFDVAGVQVNEGDKLFTVIARATRPGLLSSTLDLNSSITPAEWFDTQENVFTPALQILQSQTEGIHLLPATPNPFADLTTIPFQLQVDEAVTITFSSVDGTVLHSSSIQGVKGGNEFVLQADQMAASGMLIVSIQAGSEVKFQKVMLMRY